MTTVATSVRSGHLEVCLLEIDRQCPQWGAHQYRAGVGVGRGSVAGVTSEFSLGCNRPPARFQTGPGKGREGLAQSLAFSCGQQDGVREGCSPFRNIKWL